VVTAKELYDEFYDICHSYGDNTPEVFFYSGIVHGMNLALQLYHAQPGLQEQIKREELENFRKQLDLRLTRIEEKLRRRKRDAIAKEQ
jgi:hypothetical protein